MKMEEIKIVLWITYFGAYMDISDDLRLRLLQQLPLQANSWLVEYTQVQVLSQNCHQKNSTTPSPSPPKKTQSWYWTTKKPFYNQQNVIETNFILF